MYSEFVKEVEQELRARNIKLVRFDKPEIEGFGDAELPIAAVHCAVTRGVVGGIITLPDWIADEEEVAPGIADLADDMLRRIEDAT